jgi:hypothetical protein
MGDEMREFLAFVTASWCLFAPSAAWSACSTKTLAGQYIFLGRGFIEPLAPTVQRVHSGVYAFDGVANVLGKETSSRGGNVTREQKLTGTYTLNADCTGSMTMISVFDSKLRTHYDIFVTDDGRKANMIRTDPGSMAVRTIER